VWFVLCIFRYICGVYGVRYKLWMECVVLCMVYVVYVSILCIMYVINGVYGYN
jgi:hypothetical protein